MENNNFEYGLQDMNEMTVTLTLEDDSELLCGVVAIFPVEDKDYIALDPLEHNRLKYFLGHSRAIIGYGYRELLVAFAKQNGDSRSLRLNGVLGNIENV